MRKTVKLSIGARQNTASFQADYALSRLHAQYIDAQKMKNIHHRKLPESQLEQSWP